MFLFVLMTSLLSQPTLANNKPVEYEYGGYHLKMKIEELAKKHPEALHQYMVRNSKKVHVLDKEEPKTFYKNMFTDESIYSISTNQVKNNQVVPIAPEIQSAKLLIRDKELKGIELRLTKEPCLTMQKKMVMKYGEPDSRNIAVGSRVWIWLSGEQTLVLDEKLCNLHINYNNDVLVPGTKPKK